MSQLYLQALEQKCKESEEKFKKNENENRFLCAQISLIKVSYFSLSFLPYFFLISFLLTFFTLRGKTREFLIGFQFFRFLFLQSFIYLFQFLTCLYFQRVARDKEREISQLSKVLDETKVSTISNCIFFSNFFSYFKTQKLNERKEKENRELRLRIEELKVQFSVSPKHYFKKLTIITIAGTKHSKCHNTIWDAEEASIGAFPNAKSWIFHFKDIFSSSVINILFISH